MAHAWQWRASWGHLPSLMYHLLLLSLAAILVTSPHSLLLAIQLPPPQLRPFPMVSTSTRVTHRPPGPHLHCPPSSSQPLTSWAHPGPSPYQKLRHHRVPAFLCCSPHLLCLLLGALVPPLLSPSASSKLPVQGPLPIDTPSWSHPCPGTVRPFAHHSDCFLASHLPPQPCSTTMALLGSACSAKPELLLLSHPLFLVL